jgi:hypothetical protein
LGGGSCTQGGTKGADVLVMTRKESDIQRFAPAPVYPATPVLAHPRAASQTLASLSKVSYTVPLLRPRLRPWPARLAGGAAMNMRNRCGARHIPLLPFCAKRRRSVVAEALCADATHVDTATADAGASFAHHHGGEINPTQRVDGFRLWFLPGQPWGFYTSGLSERGSAWGEAMAMSP